MTISVQTATVATTTSFIRSLLIMGGKIGIFPERALLPVVGAAQVREPLVAISPHAVAVPPLSRLEGGHDGREASRDTGRKRSPGLKRFK